MNILPFTASIIHILRDTNSGEPEEKDHTMIDPYPPVTTKIALANEDRPIGILAKGVKCRTERRPKNEKKKKLKKKKKKKL